MRKGIGCAISKSLLDQALDARGPSYYILCEHAQRNHTQMSDYTSSEDPSSDEGAVQLNVRPSFCQQRSPDIVFELKRQPRTSYKDSYRPHGFPRQYADQRQAHELLLHAEDVPSEASLSEVSASESDSHDSGDESEEPDAGCAPNKEARASAPQRTSRRRQTLEQQSLPVNKAPDNKAIKAGNGDLTQKAMRKSGASLPVPRQQAPANAAKTDDIDPEESEAASQHRRNENIAAMLGGRLASASVCHVLLHSDNAFPSSYSTPQ